MIHQARAWAMIHGTRSAVVLLVLACAIGAVAKGVTLPALGPISLPESFPVGALLPVILGVALGLFCHAAVDPRVIELAPGRRRLVPVRALWVGTGTATAVLAGSWVFASGDYGPSAVAANVVLFAGLALSLVVLGRPDQAWLAPATWCLVAMVFGYRGGSTADWYWWAFPLDPDVSIARVVLSGAVWAAAAVAYSGRPLGRPGRPLVRPGRARAGS